MSTDTAHQADAASVAVIGAGAGGLTAAKNLLEGGYDVDVFEAGDGLGGNWYFGSPQSSIYDSVHTITSKPFTAYTDYPMPEEYPTFLGHRHCLEYLQAYAGDFGVTPHIRYNSRVVNVERDVTDAVTPWVVTVEGEEPRRYSAVAIANGHLWKPKYPNYPGYFTGQTIHSGDYKTPEMLRDKRVLVVGAGNSGCDIAVEATQHASAVFHSTRRGYYFWPKYLFGLPSDVVYEWGLKSRLPLPVRRVMGHMALTLNSAGQATQYGLPKPSQKLYDEHFIINSTLMYHLGHGDIAPKPDIMELAGDEVVFTDGSREQIDVIVYATGFHLSEFPFIDPKHLNVVGNHPKLHLQGFHPVYDDLFVIGHFQTSTGYWPLMDYQSQIMTAFLQAAGNGAPEAEAFRSEKAAMAHRGKLRGGLSYYASGRHELELEHFAFRSALTSTLSGLRPGAGRGPLGAVRRLTGARP